jgi:hypothetical protein
MIPATCAPGPMNAARDDLARRGVSEPPGWPTRASRPAGPVAHETTLRLGQRQAEYFLGEVPAVAAGLHAGLLDG